MQKPVDTSIVICPMGRLVILLEGVWRGLPDVQAKELETELDAAFIEVEYQISVDSCKDHDVSVFS